ncbi:hypothetical protein R5W24_004674 [Gemmata sp. JC717]|uniref:Uncharacterized protein n=1 Tax=Gemmata algarum TaxID=2975278 RepID=A0ABU5F4F8_9BACT|nr:hypothetical protein [Gemmata algarum]MDY3555531.1 hypothetical protein [Gemmata algarum]MDY3562458.1 hypothetical protein [Gemmata algarum]
MHLLAAYAPQAPAVIAQMTVVSTTNEHKAALRLLGVLPLAGAVVTADAMLTHADVCQGIVEGHGDYVRRGYSGSSGSTGGSRTGCTTPAM